MKYLVAFAFITTYFFSFGQTDMFWNNYSNFNPAMSGFQYTQHTAINIQEYSKANKGLETIRANYNQRIFEQHGVGINYSGTLFTYMNNVLNLNYNYQFDLKKAGKLSTGLGVGVVNYQLKKESSYYDPPRTYLNLTIGTAYSWKNLIVGVSTTNLTPIKYMLNSSTFVQNLGISAHAGYAFQIGENFQLTPRLLYTSANKFQQLRFNMTTTFKNKFSVGLSAQPNDNYGVNIGWNIKEKFQVAYMINTNFSKLNNGASLGHEFSIGYVIK